MILHVIQDSEYGNDFIQFLYENYDRKDHFVYVIKNEDHLSMEDKYNEMWDYLCKENFSCFARKSKKAEKIIIHGFFDYIMYKWLFLHPLQRRKTVISIWGGDLYSHYDRLQDPLLSNRILEIVKMYLFRKIKLFLNDMAEDYFVLKKWYHVKGKSIHVIYPSSVDMDFLQTVADQKNRNPVVSKVKRVLMGNSATKTNLHFETLELLKKYKHSDMEIYCPLSYGDHAYAKKVVAKGKEIFGEKFIPILEYMTPDDYGKLLSTMDIAIFNNNRQQAMGNIAILAYMGAKLFLRDDTTMWEQYVKKGDCGFHNVSDIALLSFEEFAQNSMEDQLKNKRYFERLWDVHYLKKMWDEAFAYKM